MIGRRAIRFPFLWIALAFAAMALAPGGVAGSAKPAARWTAIPAVPHPLAFQAGQSERLVRASFGTDVPALRSAVFSPDCRQAAERRGCDRQFRIDWLEFAPLAERPPPSFS